MRKLGIVRRLVGCFYCGQPCRGDVCRYCSDLPLKDPLVAKARLPLSEAERFSTAFLTFPPVLSDATADFRPARHPHERRHGLSVEHTTPQDRF